MPEVAGLVLAGGRSRRFGRDKLLEPYRGIPLVHHPILRLGEICSEVVVLIAPDASEPPLPAGVRVRIVRDPASFAGPLAAMAGALGGLEAELALLVGGDMPELQTRVLLAMIGRAARPEVEAVALEDGGRPRPLPLLVRRERGAAAADELRRTGRARLRDLLEGLRLEVIEEPAWVGLDPERRTVFDVDEPADLAR